MARFLFADVPVVLFDSIFEPPTRLQLRWPRTSGYHLSGYYGGLWLAASS
jgi:hypothetical protein